MDKRLKLKIMKPKLVEIMENDWIVSYPKCVNENFEEYWDAVELMNSNPKTAEKGLKKIIENCPKGHIDAILHLGFLYNDTGKKIEGNALINKAHSIALEAIPDKFDETKDKIIWASLENRPFLRTFQGAILELMKETEYESAIEKCRFVLNVNPNDNQGIRYLLLECYFHQKEPKNVLKLINEYEEEWSLDFSYGGVLANLQLKKIEKAKELLRKALVDHPKTGKEITKKRHSEPRNEGFYGGIVLGSDYEAYDYWIRNGEFWKETNGAIEFVKENTK